MTDAVWIAVIASLLAPPLMAWLQNRFAVAKEARENARADEVAAKADAVAAQAAKAAQLLLDQQAEQARLLKENNRVVSEQAAKTNREIQVLTGMLDGNFTKLMEDNLVALSNGLLLSRKLLAMTFEAGHETDQESLAEIRATEARIGELKKAIAERKHTDAAALLVEHTAQPNSTPLPVTDDRTAIAAERSATALERAADAAEDKNAE